VISGNVTHTFTTNLLTAPSTFVKYSGLIWNSLPTYPFLILRANYESVVRSTFRLPAPHFSPLLSHDTHSVAVMKNCAWISYHNVHLPTLDALCPTWLFLHRICRTSGHRHE